MSPTEILLEFSQRIPLQLTTITLSDAGGVTVPLSALEYADSSRTVLTTRPPGVLTPGEYRVDWRTVGQDGHVIVGSFVFLVTGARAATPDEVHTGHDMMHAATPEEEATAATNPSQSWIAVIARWLNFVALVSMIGAVCARMFVLPRTLIDAATAVRIRRDVWRYARLAGGLAIFALFARLFSQSAAIHGVGEAFSLERISIMLAITPWGHAWAIQAAATGIFLGGLVIAARSHIGWAVAFAAAVILAFVPAMSGHAAAVGENVLVIVFVDALHVFGASLWVGSLAVLLLAAFNARAQLSAAHVRAIVTAFSPTALTGAAIVVVSGVIRALEHISHFGQLTSTGYGRALLLKLSLVLVIAALGFFNWRIATPRLHSDAGAAQLRRAATMETVAGAAVLLVTAVLVALSPP